MTCLIAPYTSEICSFRYEMHLRREFGYPEDYPYSICWGEVFIADMVWKAKNEVKND